MDGNDVDSRAEMKPAYIKLIIIKKYLPNILFRFIFDEIIQLFNFLCE